MNWLRDAYVITVADLVGGYCGRGYSHKTGTFSNLVANPPTRLMSRHILRSMSIRFQRTGLFIQGLFVSGYIHGDEQQTDYVVPWWAGVQSKGHHVTWQGRQEMLCGMEWRVNKGGVLAGDLIYFDVGYE